MKIKMERDIQNCNIWKQMKLIDFEKTLHYKEYIFITLGYEYQEINIYRFVLVKSILL